MFPAYVISCNNQEKELLSRLKQYNINATIFSCINSKNKSSDNLYNEYIHPLAKPFIPKSAMAIAISHMMVWKEFLNTNLDKVMILENDVIFVHPNDFNLLFPKVLANTPKSFDILYLGCFGCHNNFNFFTVVGGKKDIVKINSYINKPKVAYALHAYILSRKGALKLLHNLEGKVYYHIDFCIQKLVNKNKIETYVCDPRLAYQSSTDEEISSNTPNNYPLILTEPLSHFYVDRKVKANYFLKVGIFRLGNFTFNISNVIMLLLGIMFRILKLSICFITIFFICISLPDIILNFNMEILLVNYILIMLPTVILWKK